MALPLQLIVLALAVWRISYMLVWEEGPYSMFEVLRARCGITETDTGSRMIAYENPHQWTLSGVLTCVYCMSVWVGTLFAVLFYFVPVFATYFALPFFLSAVAVLIEGAKK